MEKILRSYLRRLTNLSANNRSLLLLRLISDQFLDLHLLDYANDHPSFGIIQSLISKKDPIKLCDEIDPRDSETNTISYKLRKILRIEQFIFEERGARDLYIGWPFIKGKFSDGTLVRCPLIFFPVQLEQKKNSWYLRQRKEVNITFNKTFLLAYSYYNKVSPDEEMIEYVLEGLNTDSTVYRTQIYELLKKSNVEVHFNQENFIDKLSTFENFKKIDFDNKEKNGRLKIFPEAVLGIFPQAGSYLVPDYIKLLENEKANSLANFFSKGIFKTSPGQKSPNVSTTIHEETTFTPFEIDASQENALHLIKKGNSLVVQGPPGTGKSQLICNLISDFIARGKNVLMVCQKKAALDVVYERLKSQQINDFIGLVHDFKNDRKQIFQQIALQIDSIDEYRQKNNSLDSIYLERTFLQSSRKIDQLTEELNEFKDILFDERECGKSIKELYLTSDPNASSISLNQEYRGFRYDYVDEFVNKLSRFLDYHRKFGQGEDFWSSGPSFSQFGTSDLIKIKEILDYLPEYHDRLKLESTTFSGTPLDFESCLYFLSLRPELEKLRNNLDNNAVYSYYKHMLAHNSNEEEEKENEDEPVELPDMERAILQCFKGAGPEISLRSRELGRFQEALEHAIKARKGLFSLIRWRLFSDDKIFITRVLVANELKSNKEGFEVLLERIDNRLNYEHMVSRIQNTPWLTGFPLSYRKIDIQNWFFYQKLALKCLNLTHKVRAFTEILKVRELDRKEFIERIQSFIAYLDQIPAQLQLWSRYISETQIRSILLNKIKIETVKKMLNEDFDSLVEYHKLKENFSSPEQKVIDELLEKTSVKKEIITIFSNSLALAWIDHIEAKYPVLKSVSSFKLSHLTKELKQAVLDKTNASLEILLLKSRERTYEDLEFNRLNNPITYRDLYHQVTKKRKVWPIRKLLSSFHDEIFSLLPCWMTSPESASAIFPMEEVFDLVIFDEASQCFGERAIPAMYRGKQVVIVGDDKQLQPNDLYRVRWEDEEDDETPELEIDSLLSLAKKYLPEVSLRSHYRSRSLELIEFSNLNFYGGKLKLLPDFNAISKSGPAIHYIKVDGIWKNNTNEEEANEVVKLVNKISREKKGKSIGVVTFNVRQQGFILDLLELSLQKDRIRLPKKFFIKNIENVQGDECDILIFSTVYAPDERGKVQLRFGSLNMAGGENRLNVAISRAKEEIHLITSLYPNQLNVEKVTNEGPRLLKEYLQYTLDVNNGEWTPNSHEDKSRSPDWYLRKKLAQKNAKVLVRKELPFSDLTVISSNLYKGLILTDDDLFFDTLSAKETYCYRENLFVEKSWPFIQFHSREYWINRDHIMEKLNKFIERII